MSCGADTEANALLTSLTAGLSFTIPTIDLTGTEFQFPGGAASPIYTTVARVELTDLTTGTVGGAGAFDTLMTSIRAHLRDEYDNGRITGDQYTKAYIALTEAAMSNATNFVLSREKTFWDAINGQLAAIIARHEIEVKKLEVATAQIGARNQEATYALTKIKLATEDVNYCIATYNHTYILPEQKTKLINENSVLVKQAAFVTEQTESQRAQTLDTRIDGVTAISGLIGKQKTLTDKQIALVMEQTESQRAQTSNTRTDGVTAVAGLLGKQKDLYTQQITAYQRDAETKVAKIFSDAWITQKTIDEGLTAPTGFTNNEINEVLSIIRTNNGLGS